LFARQSNNAGFTLVEIMTVLVIIGLVTSVAILTMPTPKSGIEIQANKLTAELNALSQDGLISGRVNAVGFSKDGYTLYSYRDGQWEERLSDDWDDGYRLQYTRNETAVDIPKTITPGILFQPTGLSTPFELTLSSRDITYAIKTEGNGRVELVKSIP